MLRRSFVAFVATLHTLCHAQQSLPSEREGLWRGDARLFNVKLRAKTGEIPVLLLFGPDEEVSGRIGSAIIPMTRPKFKTSQRVEYQVVVLGRVHQELDDGLDRLVIIVTINPERVLDADFHLKRRFGFDPAMVVGHFDVERRN